MSGFWIAAMIAIWLAFAPTQAGGMASYIIVIGNSMEPGFHIGDFIVHEEADYQLGMRVVYRNLELQFRLPPCHRTRKWTFPLQETTTPADTYQPSQDEVIGKLWLHIPKGGNAIQKIRNLSHDG
jgi:signal peptidase